MADRTAATAANFEAGRLDQAARASTRCRCRSRQAAAPGENQWAQQLGPVGPIARAGRKSGTPLTPRFKLTSILSFLAFVAIYSAASGMKFGIGFAVLILIHEMGHFIDIKRRGLPADMPVFLPGLGAYVRWQAMGVPLETRAAVSLAGPLAGFLASLACAVLWWQTGNPFWAALARVGAVLNLLNLIPVWVLDGGQAALALSKAERIVLLTACVVLGLALGQRLFFLVALGAGYRAFFAGGFSGASQPRHDSLLSRGADRAGRDHPADAGTRLGAGVKRCRNCCRRINLFYTFDQLFRLSGSCSLALFFLVETQPFNCLCPCVAYRHHSSENE